MEKQGIRQYLPSIWRTVILAAILFAGLIVWWLAPNSETVLRDLLLAFLTVLFWPITKFYPGFAAIVFVIFIAVLLCGTDPDNPRRNPDLARRFDSALDWLVAKGMPKSLRPEWREAYSIHPEPLEPEVSMPAAATELERPPRPASWVRCGLVALLVVMTVRNWRQRGSC